MEDKCVDRTQTWAIFTTLRTLSITFFPVLTRSYLRLTCALSSSLSSSPTYEAYYQNVASYNCNFYLFSNFFDSFYFTCTFHFICKLTVILQVSVILGMNNTVFCYTLFKSEILHHLLYHQRILAQIYRRRPFPAASFKQYVKISKDHLRWYFTKMIHFPSNPFLTNLPI